ncbi:MAG: Outer membrane protein assembly factor BamB [bacterium]|nr:Outer membrane protein assembly factor BamB [bacterium]
MPTSTQSARLLSILVGLVLSNLALGEKTPLSEHFGLVHGDPKFTAELGSAWTRFDFTWAGIERERGVFDFRDLPERVEESLALGVNILPILDYEPAWDPERSPADEQTFADWERYVETTVARFKGKLRYWQAWNEPNITFWKPKPNPRDYAELLRRTWLGAKRADPDARVLGINTSDIDLEFTEEVFRYGGLQYCDILAFQPYRIAPEVGHFEEIEALRALVDRFGEQRPIWFTEVGWDSKNFPFHDADNLSAERPSRRHAAFLSRYMTLIRAAGIDKAFWFSQAADGYGLEVRRPEAKKRLSFHSYQYLISLLEGMEEVRELAPRGAGGLYAFLFRRVGSSVAVAWSAHGEQKLTLPGISKVPHARTLCGWHLPVPAADEITVGPEPVFFLMEHPPQELLDASSLQVSPSRVWLRPGEQKPVRVTHSPWVDESGSQLLTVRSSQPGVSTLPRSLALEPDAPQAFRIAAARNSRPTRGMVDLKMGNRDWQIEVNVTPYLLWRFTGSSEGYLTPVALEKGKGDLSILLAAYDTGEILCLRPDGSVRWSFKESDPINHAVVVADVNESPGPEIVASMPGRQTVLALSSEGVLQWRARIEGELPKGTAQWSWTRPTVADLEGDGSREILYSDPNGVLTILSGSGETRLSRKVSEHRCDRPVAVANLVGDKRKEILVGDSAGVLRCLSSDGDVVWEAGVEADLSSPPVVGVVGREKTPSVLAATHGERVFRFSSDGRRLWSVDVGGTVDLGTGVVLADLDKDGGNEILVSTRNHELLALSADGRILWRLETGAQLRSTPVVGDVDGDADPEILIGSADWLLWCIDPGGWVRWTANLGGRVDGSPLLVDLNEDRVLDIVVPVRGGDVVAYSIRSAVRR